MGSIEELQEVIATVEQIDADPEHKLPQGITAVIKNAYRSGGDGLTGFIYYDSMQRFVDGYPINLWEITRIEPGGIYHTKHNKYLVEMIDPEVVHG